ncbi:MAG: cytidine deaminase, partial [Candidatus Eremiobacteraeota bacterium]|nr:cytidine deaminase [Candidatus Eremiobacteraeota bacterium]
MSSDELLEHAGRARENAYAPYSKFTVGAAVDVGDGRVVTGCNVENASYGLSICAERVALT